MSHHASWLKPIFDEQKIRLCAEGLAEQINLDKTKIKIDAIVVSGISGASIGGLLSYLTNLPLIVVRKDNDETHSDYRVEYKEIEKSTLHYVFVDDLIASGATIKRVVEKMNLEINVRCYFEKIYLYSSKRNYDFVMDKKNIKVFGIDFCDIPETKCIGVKCTPVPVK